MTSEHPGKVGLVSVFASRDPWVKLVGTYALVVPAAGLITWAITGHAADAVGAALTALGLGLLTAGVLWLRLRP